MPVTRTREADEVRAEAVQVSGVRNDRRQHVEVGRVCRVDIESLVDERHREFTVLGVGEAKRLA